MDSTLSAQINQRPEFQNSAAELASLPDGQNLKFERADWTSFRTVEGLCQKAGVPPGKLRSLVLKELADNALDSARAVGIGIGELPNGRGYFVEDQGPGIGGTPGKIAALFSIARPMVSTKLLRLPTRGALGNGLRVVAGAVLASGGSLSVTTRDRRIVLRPERDGTTTVVSAEAVSRPTGTRIEIGFGSVLPADDAPLSWALRAYWFSRNGTSYTGKSSPHWYDAAQFLELISASGTRPVRDLIANLDGCSGGKAGEIVSAAGLERTLCQDITAKKAARLLDFAQDAARPVQAKRLGGAGDNVFPGYAYSRAYGTARFGATEPKAAIPFVVEAWAKKANKTTLGVCGNRTPVTGPINAVRDKRDIDVYGCGLHHTIANAPKEAQFEIWVNITTPYMPITSDGKAPNLKPFLDEIGSAVGKAVKKAHLPNAKGNSQKEVVLDNLDEAVARAGGGRFRFGERQVFYQLRKIVRDALGTELKIGNFKAIITDYEAEHGEIERMYREPRGSIYHPHRGETITLGTLMVEDYERPEWTFNKVIYVEKEGFSEALKDARWAERHDCMLMSSKGFTTRAARTVKKPSAAALENGIKQMFEREQDREWRDHIQEIVPDIV
jgi:hypothetical protein